MRRWQVIPHPADFRLRVGGSTLAELFEAAAIGMFAAIKPLWKKNAKSVEYEVVVEGADHETLLVNFLNELLYRSDTENVAFDEAQVTLTDTKLHAAVSCRPIERFDLEIKAVTFYNLEIRRTPRGFEAVITFDI